MRKTFAALMPSQKALMPDINRMNPMSGFKRLYGPEAIAEFTKSLLRVAFVGVAAGLVVWTGFDTLRGLIHHPLETAITDGLGFTLRLLLATAGVNRADPGIRQLLQSDEGRMQGADPSFTARLLGTTASPNNGQPINANAELERRAAAPRPAAKPAPKKSGGWFDWF